MRRNCIEIVLCLFLVLIAPIGCFSLEDTFGFESISSDKQQSVREHLGLKRVTSDSRSYVFSTYDVNESGLVAIGSWSAEPCLISVFQLDGTFLYGYQFATEEAFELKWNDTDLLIHLLRSDYVIELSSVGGIQNIYEITSKTFSSDFFKKRNEIIVGNSKVVVQNDLGILNFFSANYSQVLLIDETGLQTVIYDSSDVQLVSALTTCLILLFLLIGIPILIVITLKNLRKPRGGSAS